MADVGAKVRESTLTQGPQETIEAARAELALAGSPPLPQRSTPGYPPALLPPWPTRKVRVLETPRKDGGCLGYVAASIRPNSGDRPNCAERSSSNAGVRRELPAGRANGAPVPLEPKPVAAGRSWQWEAGGVCVAPHAPCRPLSLSPGPACPAPYPRPGDVPPRRSSRLCAQACFEGPAPSARTGNGALARIARGLPARGGRRLRRLVTAPGDIRQTLHSRVWREGARGLLVFRFCSLT